MSWGAGWALLLAAGAGAVTPHARTVRAAEMHAGYVQSQSRCPHGHEGMLVNLHHETTAAAFRQTLEARVAPHPHTRFRKASSESEWAHVRALHLTSVHEDMLEAIVAHEHTLDVEANCIIKRELPKPLTVKAGVLAGLVSHGAWR